MQDCPVYRDFDVACWRQSLELAEYELDPPGFPFPLESGVQKGDGELEDEEVLDQHDALIDDHRKADLVRAGRRFWDAMRAVTLYDLEASLNAWKWTCQLFGPQISPTPRLSSRDFRRRVSYAMFA